MGLMSSPVTKSKEMRDDTTDKVTERSPQGELPDPRCSSSPSLSTQNRAPLRKDWTNPTQPLGPGLPMSANL